MFKRQNRREKVPTPSKKGTPAHMQHKQHRQVGVPRTREALYRTHARYRLRMAVLIDVYRFRIAGKVMHLLAQPGCGDLSTAAISGLTHRLRRDDKPSKTPKGKDSISFPLRFLIRSISTAAGGNRATSVDEGCDRLVMHDASAMVWCLVSEGLVKHAFGCRRRSADNCLNCRCMRGKGVGCA